MKLQKYFLKISFFLEKFFIQGAGGDIDQISQIFQKNEIDIPHGNKSIK